MERWKEFRFEIGTPSFVSQIYSLVAGASFNKSLTFLDLRFFIYKTGEIIFIPQGYWEHEKEAVK